MLRHAERLRGVDPRLAEVVLTVADQVSLAVLEGVRGDARQAELFASGRSRVRVSKHQRDARGLSRAVDLGVILTVGGWRDAGASPPPPPSKYPWALGEVTWEVAPYRGLAQIVAAVAASRGLPVRWGGTWTTNPSDALAGFCDAVHFEVLS